MVSFNVLPNNIEIAGQMQAKIFSEEISAITVIYLIQTDQSIKDIWVDFIEDKT